MARLRRRITYRRHRRRYRYYVVRTCKHCQGQEKMGDFPTRPLAVRFLKVVPRRKNATLSISTHPDYYE